MSKNKKKKQEKQEKQKEQKKSQNFGEKTLNHKDLKRGRKNEFEVIPSSSLCPMLKTKSKTKSKSKSKRSKKKNKKEARQDKNKKFVHFLTFFFLSE
ncbi:hypothetical protein PP707_01480 [Acetobacter pasteurianus]|nr:hypothetical protein [Acetobacter pasteurianus]